MKTINKLLLSIISAVLAFGCSSPEYDVCIYGGTSAGVVAAYASAMQGMKTILIEPSNHVGGTTTGGLGQTDIGNKQVVTGISKQFYRKLGEHYGTLEMWVFEPSVADSTMRSYLKVKGLKVMLGKRIVSVAKDGPRVKEIFLETSAPPHRSSSVRAKVFIDCSYEGDLMARSGISYTVGRESNEIYSETWNGVQLLDRHQFPDGIDPYVEPGNPASGLLWGISELPEQPNGEGDKLVQAYNYRICLTDSLENMVPITKPENYDPSRYELLLRLMEARPDKRLLKDYFIWSPMPGRKTDINNYGGFSTDAIGMNWDYPEADYDTRVKIIKEHEDYTKGLLYFVGHDERVPEELRNRMLKWGYPKDEYTSNGNWSPQLYVRESRRMIGEYVATQADCENRTEVSDGIARAAYTMDSHNTKRIVVIKDGVHMVKNEGNVEIFGGLPYLISYRSLTPKREECTNVLVPICLSASHIAYGSIRMEPVFMVLGQVAAIAAKEAIYKDISVQEVDWRIIAESFEKDPYLDGSVPDIIIDDADIAFPNIWTSVKITGGFGPTCMELSNTDDVCEIEYPFEVKTPGNYTIYIYQNNRPAKLAETIHLDVRYDDNVESVLMKQTGLKVIGQSRGAWFPVGTWHFEKNGAVVFSNKGSEGTIRVDAVLVVAN